MVNKNKGHALGVVSPPIALKNSKNISYITANMPHPFEFVSLYMTAINKDVTVTFVGRDQSDKLVKSIKVHLCAKVVTHLLMSGFVNLTSVAIKTASDSDRYIIDNVLMKVSGRTIQF